MRIRPASIEDLDGLVRLFDSYRIFYSKPSDRAGSSKFLAERLEKSDSKIFVAESPEKLLSGFVQLYPLFTSTNMKRLWLLNDLYVDVKYRGMGVSKLLIERAKQLVRDTDAYGMFLETEKSNEIGNKLYPTVGMKLNSESNYYQWVQ